MDGGLFQAQADASLGLPLAQLQQPFPKGFGRGGDNHRVAVASGGGDEVQIGFLVGTIQADDQVIRV